MLQTIGTAVGQVDQFQQEADLAARGSVLRSDRPSGGVSKTKQLRPQDALERTSKRVVV